jgi:hypothetical protein
MTPTFVTIETDDPLQFVLDLNLHRRHLNESQRAMVAASIANMPDHRPTNKGANLHNKSIPDAAEKLNVSERSVKTAKQIKEKGSPELVAAVESGKVAVSDAVVVVDLTTDQQDELLGKVTTGESKNLKAAKQKSGIGKKEAKSLDEVKDIADKALALKEYARQAKNKQGEIDFAEIRMRAERRLGQMLRDKPMNKGAAAGGKKESSRGTFTEPRDTTPTLAELGIDKKLSSSAKKIGAIPDDKYEELVGEWRDRVLWVDC